MPCWLSRRSSRRSLSHATTAVSGVTGEGGREAACEPTVACAGGGRRRRQQWLQLLQRVSQEGVKDRMALQAWAHAGMGARAVPARQVAPVPRLHSPPGSGTHPLPCPARRRSHGKPHGGGAVVHAGGQRIVDPAGGPARQQSPTPACQHMQHGPARPGTHWSHTSPVNRANRPYCTSSEMSIAGLRIHCREQNREVGRLRGQAGSLTTMRRGSGALRPRSSPLACLNMRPLSTCTWKAQGTLGTVCSALCDSAARAR